MNFIIRILITAGVSYGLSEVLQGVHFQSFGTAIIFAIILGFLNTFIKPIFSLIGLPITMLTLGFFSLVINAVIVLLADYFVENMHIDSFLTAFLFSILLSVCTSILHGIFTDK